MRDKVVPFFEENGLRLHRILTDRGSEYCGNIDRHEYQLFLANKGIKHTRTKPRSPQTNGICERFNRTFKNEFVSVKLRSKMYSSREEFQQDADIWLNYYNTKRAYSGKTPIKTFLDGIELAKIIILKKYTKRRILKRKMMNIFYINLILCLLIMGREMKNNCKIISKNVFTKV